MKDLQKLLQAEINWQISKSNDFVFTAYFNGKQFMLRLNDFPEEPLCTVICEGEEQDLDDRGKKWRLPEHKFGGY